MRILLAAINAKYIHSNLAVYSLKASAGKYEPQVELAEYTINHLPEEIFGSIYRKKPELLFFSCYIWNRQEVIRAAETIRKVLPETVIWAGGPEVSYDAEAFLQENPQFDGVMIGEGEQTFRRLLEYYVDGLGALEEIPGIACRAAAKQPAAAPCASLDSLPFVYQDLREFENRIIYYESSRGCPFSCSYCLSSIDRRVRFRSMELVERELAYFLEQKVRQVKFVDRTFNCSHERTLELWKFIRDHDNGVTNFHFEISADLLNEEELSVLAGMRPGLVQLEIGVQTVCQEALRAIHRSAPFEKIAEHVKRIASHHNIHQHLDLIAGLPYEDFESFRTSFDTVYRLHPQELQLGFLKVLCGSEMHQRAEEYGIIYCGQPPYEVLATRWITCDELLRLKEIEEMLEIYYNSQQFRNTILAAEQLFARPVELYEALADYYQEKRLIGKSFSRMQRFEILHDFLCRKAEACGKPSRIYEELLILDLYLRENAKSRPSWAEDPAQTKETALHFYQQEAESHRYLPGYAQMSWKQSMRMTHLERFRHLGEKELWILFDYKERDPLTGDARMQEIRERPGEHAHGSGSIAAEKE